MRISALAPSLALLVIVAAGPALAVGPAGPSSSAAPLTADDDDGSRPGFGAVALLVALAGLVALGRRRR